MIGSLAFTTPALLVALIALPILWWLLRAVPPAPIRRRFPGVALLLGLRDDDSESDKTPWWLLLLRMLAVAAAIIGFAGPILNPEESRGGSGPLLLAMDGSWASARDWPDRIERAELLLAEAGRDGRPVAIVLLTDLPPGELAFQTADAALSRLPNLDPQPFAPDATAVVEWAEAIDDEVETYWFSDGLDWPERQTVTTAFESLGPLTVFEGDAELAALSPAGSRMA